ncbi:hypothetical protein GDO78_006694 [Eleutherodactylus coqui]|uniref:Uncharacterized protein n=1 Tax=Eleutherodactylus coqui TaxID=57060 RepID=A0A8J6KEY6_ELECQ|nr:hypothetical protein GDO78_006694 [Eleutherodactylus coqui]
MNRPSGSIFRARHLNGMFLCTTILTPLEYLVCVEWKLCPIPPTLSVSVVSFESCVSCRHIIAGPCSLITCNIAERFVWSLMPRTFHETILTFLLTFLTLYLPQGFYSLVAAVLFYFCE